jgi:hypothetical protein
MGCRDRGNGNGVDAGKEIRQVKHTHLYSTAGFLTNEAVFSSSHKFGNFVRDGRHARLNFEVV